MLYNIGSMINEKNPVYDVSAPFRNNHNDSIVGFVGGIVLILHKFNDFFG